MELIMSIINLAVIPYVGMSIMYRRNHREMKWSANLMTDWAIFTVVNIPVTHVAITLISKLSGGVIGVVSPLYTIIATIFTCLLPYCIQIIKKYVELKLDLKFEVESVDAADEEK